MQANSRAALHRRSRRGTMQPIGEFCHAMPIRNTAMLFLKEAVLAVAVAFILLLPGSGERTPINVFERSSPTSAAHYMAGSYLAARFAEQHHLMPQAAAYYRKALAQDAENEDLLATTYELMAFSGDFEKARSLAGLHAEKDKNATLAHLLLALDRFQRGDLAGAEKTLAALQPQGDAHASELEKTAVSLVLAWAEAGEGRTPEAAARLDLIVDGPARSFTRYQQMMIHAMGEDWEKTKSGLSDLHFSGVPYRFFDLAAWLYRAHGDTAKADEILAAGVAEDPSYLYRDPLFSAQSSTTDKAKLGLAEALFEMAARGQRDEDSDRAVMYLRMALALCPAFEDAELLLGHILAGMDLHQDAVTAFQTVPDTSRLYWRAQTGIAQEYASLGNKEAAQQLLLALATREKSRFEPFLILGDMLLAEDRFQEAAEIYTRALERLGGKSSESDWAIYYARGICYEQAGDWDKAETDFYQALNLSPNQPSVLNYLGYSWLLLGKNVHKAEEMLRKAVTRDPTDPHILDSYGWALYKLGTFTEALVFLERANALMPYDPTTNDHLGDIYWQLGRRLEATYQWKRALACNPEPKDRTAIEQKLRDGVAPIALAQ